MSPEALAMTRRFRGLVRHIPVAQTWHTPRPEAPPQEPPSLFEILRNFSPEFAMEAIMDVMEGIFDVDAHYMMNFYPHLAG